MHSFIQLLNLLKPRNPPPVAYGKAAVTPTEIKKRAHSLFTEHLTLLSVLWHHRNSPLFKDQLKAWSQPGLPSALRWSMPPQNAGHCSTSLLTIVPPHSISMPGGRDSSYNQALGLQVQRCICALPTDTLSHRSCCSFPPTGNPMWWEKSCRVCEHPYT